MEIVFYKQLTHSLQNAKQLSWLSPLSLNTNKNYRLKESGVFLCNKRKIVVKLTTYQNSAV